jgi:hypothetical protein
MACSYPNAARTSVLHFRFPPRRLTAETDGLLIGWIVMKQEV